MNFFIDVKNLANKNIDLQKRLSPQEKKNITKFYDELEKTITDKKKTQQLLTQTIEQNKLQLKKSKTQAFLNENKHLQKKTQTKER